MRVRFSPRAVRELDDIFAFLTQRNPKAAAETVRRIEAFAYMLGQYPRIGQATDTAGVRRVALPRLPYVLFFTRLATNEVRILRVRHAKRRPLQL